MTSPKEAENNVLPFSEKKEGTESTVLITGGKGFIGSHLVDRLLKNGKRILTFDNAFRKVPYEGWDTVKHIQGDITDKASLRNAVVQSDYVFHLAGVLGTSETIGNPKRAILENTVGTVDMLDAIKDYGKKGTMITIGGINWLNPYAITKKAAEQFSLMYQKESGIDLKIVRGLNTYGSRQEHEPVRKAVPNFIINALRNQPLEIFGDGNQILDLVYVEDMIEVMVRVMNYKGIIDHIIDAGTGIGVTVNDLAQTIIDLTHSNSQIQHVPMRPGEPEHSITLGDTKTLREIGYVPSTSLAEGLAKTIPWYKANISH